MKRLLVLLFLTTLTAMLTGCAVTLPTNAYTPQNFVRTQGEVGMGEFDYAPYVEGKIKNANQIQSTAAGQIFISTNVADFVKRGTALELEKSGVVLDDASLIQLCATIIEFKADDLGYSVHWHYSIQYRIIQKGDNIILFSKTFTPQFKKTGKFGLPMDYANTVGEMILSGYDMFIRDPDAKRLLESNTTRSATPVAGMPVSQPK